MEKVLPLLQWKIVLLYLLWELCVHRRLNHRPDEQDVLPGLGAGTLVTLGRGFLCSLLACFLFMPRPEGFLSWIPALLYLAVFLSDAVDGYLARVRNHATLLGAHLDVAVDALGVLLATALAVQYGQLPPWYLATGMAYYAFRLHRYVRRRRGLPVYELPFSTNRRVIGGFQVGFLCVVLWPVFTPPGTTLAGVLFAVPFFGSFARDWLVTSGHLRPEAAAYRALRAWVQRLVLLQAPLLVRVGLAGAVLALLSRGTEGPAAWQAMLEQAGYGTAYTLEMLLAALTVLSTVLVLLGLAGRLAGLGLLTVACTDLLLAGFDRYNAPVLSGALLIMLLGTGALSLWQPEDVFLRRRVGDPAAA